MRVLRLGLAALAFGGVLSGCSGKSGALAPLNTTPKDAEAYIAKLVAEPFKGKATAAADIAAVRDALPKEISLTWGALNFDAATRATVLIDVKVTPADMPNIGLSIAEVRLWDFDADFAKARLTGQRLAETASLARRIEAKDIAVFGLETLMAPMTQAGATIGSGLTQPLIDPLLSDPSISEEVREQIREQMRTQTQMSLDGYEISIANFILDDVMLRPFELKPVQLPPGNDFAEAMPFLQTNAAILRTIAVDTVVAKDATLKYAMTQGNQKLSMDMSADTYGVRGLRGGDIDVAVLRGAKMDASTPNPSNPGAPLAVSMGAELLTMEGTRFDKLYGYLGKGEWPPRTDTNLMSYGRFVVSDGRIGMNGQDFFAVGEALADLRDFHWFIPTKARLSLSDFTFDMNAIMNLQEAMGVAPPSPAVDGAPFEDFGDGPFDPRILEVLKRYGLDKPSLDMAFGWDWNPTSGAATIDAAYGLDDFMRFDIKVGGSLPGFKGVSDLIPGGFETADGDAIGQLFATVSNLKLIEANLIDEGGLDKAFALAVEIGKMVPVEPGQVDFFANQTPESLRQAAVALVYAARDQAAIQAPALKDLLSPFGAFVEKGGKVRITFTPAKPLDGKLLEQVQTGMIAPADLLKDVKVVHTPPAGGPVKPN